MVKELFVIQFINLILNDEDINICMRLKRMKGRTGMGLIISTVILYSIILGIDVLVKKKDIKKGKRVNGMDHLIVVVAGNGILTYICSSSSYTDGMRTTIIAIFTVLYVLFGLICLKIDNEKKE